MDAFYNFFSDHFGLSLVNSTLLWGIFILVRQRYNGLLSDIETSSKRIARLEKTLWMNGIKLEAMEE